MQIQAINWALKIPWLTWGTKKRLWLPYLWANGKSQHRHPENSTKPTQNSSSLTGPTEIKGLLMWAVTLPRRFSSSAVSTEYFSWNFEENYIRLSHLFVLSLCTAKAARCCVEAVEYEERRGIASDGHFSVLFTEICEMALLRKLKMLLLVHNNICYW